MEPLEAIEDSTMVLIEAIVSPPLNLENRENSEKHEIPRAKHPQTTKTTI